MARNPWENMDAVGAHPAQRGVGFWGWSLRLLAVGGLTLAGAFYWPLYRAHKELTAEYASLNQRAQGLDKEILGIRSELSSTKAKRDELEARRGMDQSRERASRELVEQIKVDLSSKLAKYIEKGAISIAVYKNLVVVRMPSAVTQIASKTEVGADSRLGLCTLSTAVAARGAIELRIVAREAGASGETEKSRTPWELAADRSAAVARALIEKCKYPAEHVEAAVRPQGKAGTPNETADPKTAVEIEIDPGGGSALTAL